MTVALPPTVEIDWRDTCRLIPSRFPTVGILDRVASPEDLPAVFALEAMTNDRVRAEVGQIHRIPKAEWLTGQPMASVVMASFCHPRTGGGRFNGEHRGAWYAGRTLETAQREVIYHRGRELAEVGLTELRADMRLYLADFTGDFSDVREGWDAVHDPVHYTSSQHLSAILLEAGSPGVVYRSVRHPGGECLACFRPRSVQNVRPAQHFAFVWQGNPEPLVIPLGLHRTAS
ncbi:MAG: RES family NAD+ phosphorylase [Bryobacteraceae bacterium]|nr:RES family NAD+ phosphorylase [Bryobacteraceae bacterium]